MSVLYVRDENGNFKEMKTLQGPKGDPGSTPERGVDYWTEADKTEIVSNVLTALPNASGVSF